MASPYIALQARTADLEHAFVNRHGIRPGHRIKRYIRVSGIHSGHRRHISRTQWSGLKRDLLALLTRISFDAPSHEDLRYVLCVTRSDVASKEFEVDVTDLVAEINIGR